MSLTKTTDPEPDEPDNKPDEPRELTDQQGAPGTPTVVTAPTSTARLIATTVQDWRPPPGPRGKGWVRAIAYNGSGIAVAFLTGITRNTYIALDQMAINPDAVAGIGLSGAIAALMISRSKWTWISLGIALAMVLLIRMLTLPVFTGLLAAFIAWGLDQWIRTMRQPFAWTARAAFTTLALATFALVWTTVVPVLTGAHQ